MAAAADHDVGHADRLVHATTGGASPGDAPSTHAEQAAAQSLDVHRIRMQPQCSLPSKRCAVWCGVTATRTWTRGTHPSAIWSRWLQSSEHRGLACERCRDGTMPAPEARSAVSARDVGLRAVISSCTLPNRIVPSVSFIASLRQAGMTREAAVSASNLRLKLDTAIHGLQS